MLSVFISYSHDSNPHRELVRSVADRLRSDGINCQIDQYINGSPPEGWSLWKRAQLEQADFVLVFCTETYNSFYSEEERGVNIEGAVLSESLYKEFSQKKKFIPVIPEGGSMEHVPGMLRGFSIYRLPQDYSNLYRVLTDQPRQRPEISSIRKMASGQNNVHSINSVYLDTLPRVQGSSFVGRKTELQELDSAWEPRNNINIVQVIGPPGIGKTVLLRYWLDKIPEPEMLITWSFSMQRGAELDPVLSFFDNISKLLEISQSDFKSDQDWIEYLAKIFSKRRCLLVLDELEFVQGADKKNNRVLARFLDSLADDNFGLCIISSRLAMPEFNSYPTVKTLNLAVLENSEALELLKSFDIVGDEAELIKLVQRFNGNTLMIKLLGGYIKSHLGGELSEVSSMSFFDGEKSNVQEMLSYYKNKLTGTSALNGIMLLSLFDDNSDPVLLSRLRSAKIPNLTKELSGDKAWKEVISQLEDQGLVTKQNNNSYFVEPLVRRFFKNTLITEYTETYDSALNIIGNYIEIYSSSIFLGKSRLDPQFNANSIASVVAELIPNIDSGAESLIGIFGSWGRGKTYLMDLIWDAGYSPNDLDRKIENEFEERLGFIQKIKNRIFGKLPVSHLNKRKFGDVDVVRVDFHAWKYQSTPQIWSFLYKVLLDKYIESPFSNKTVNGLNVVWKKLLLNKERMGLLPLLPLTLILSLATLWNLFLPVGMKFDFALFLGLGGIAFLYVVYGRLPSAIKLIQEYTGNSKIIDVLGSQKTMQDEIEILLKAWVDNDSKVLLFVDDLDRCSINKIIDLIDALRAVLDDPEISSRLIVFVAIDERILNLSIKEKYNGLNGLSDDEQLIKISHEYLDKIFLVGVRLGSISIDEKVGYLESLTNNYCYQEEITPSKFIENKEKITEEGNNDFFEVTPEINTSEAKKISSSKLSLGSGVTLTKIEQSALLEMAEFTPDTTPRQLKVLYYRFVLCKRLLKESYDPLNENHAKYILQKIIKKTIHIRINNNLIEKNFPIPDISVDTYGLDETDVSLAVNVVTTF